MRRKRRSRRTNLRIDDGYCNRHISQGELLHCELVERRTTHNLTLPPTLVLTPDVPVGHRSRSRGLSESHNGYFERAELRAWMIWRRRVVSKVLQLRN
jgi:hypothetical protein